MRSFALLAVPAAIAVIACSSSTDAPAPLPPIDDACAGPCPATKIKHLVVIVQENHTFDNYFGRYCTAPPGSNPACNDGPACCEAAPDQDPAGHAAVALDDDANGAHDPDHSAACEAEEMHGGAMDAYATAKCGSAQNIAYATAPLMNPYWDYARHGALADRYFQPVVGASSANDMYFARASFVFEDNTQGPKGAIGLSCGLSAPPAEYTDPTIADLLNGAGVPWGVYAGGYGAMADAVKAGTCPAAPADCGSKLAFYPCIYDPSDYPFAYYPSTRDKNVKDATAFADDVKNGALPAVSFVRAIGYESEHPGLRDAISAGQAFVAGVVNAVLASRYRENTLVLLTYDEGGGYFDHVAPPAASPVDGKAYGTRVPMLAIGPFARKSFVSHVVMEHSSIVKLIEYNWLGRTTGQLKTRDAVVNNMGSLLDPAAVGEAIPDR